MKTETAVAYYGTQIKLAQALGVSKQRVWNWVKVGVIPENFAYRLKAKTRGKLKVDASLYG
jgi:DNA-binding transcriptional regulator YdaS (Cro superfamily)